MKTLLKTLFIIAFLVLITQTIRHGYQRWFRSTISVLDRFEETLKGDIKKAKSLDELVLKYEDVNKKVKDYEADKANPIIEPQDKWEKEPYKSEVTVKEAINDWESKSKEIHELRFYWTCGLLLVILGYLSYFKFNQWAGVSLLISGFAEIIYWTSPSFIRESSVEFERLLTNKFIFSLLSFILLTLVASGLKILSNGSTDKKNP